MDAATPTSFIPKRPVTTATSASDVSSSGVAVSIVSIVIFIAIVGTAASYGGVILYEQQVQKDKIALQKTITQAKDGLSIDFVSDMKRLNNRIDGVKKLLKQHVVISPIFQALQEHTLRSIEYKDFSYEAASESGDATAKKTPMVNIKLSGTARGYASIALQADEFAKSSIIKNPVFSGLSVDDKKKVTFNLTFQVSADNLSYQSFIEAANKQKNATMILPDQSVNTDPLNAVPASAPMIRSQDTNILNQDALSASSARVDGGPAPVNNVMNAQTSGVSVPSDLNSTVPVTTQQP